MRPVKADKNARELEKAIFNFYYDKENVGATAVLNSVKRGIENNIMVIVPIEKPRNTKKTMNVRFRRLPVGNEGKYFIPVFTSQKELKKGKPTSVMVQPLKELLENVDKWADCIGFVVNPWGDKLMMDREMIKLVLGYTPKSHISFIKGSVDELYVNAIVKPVAEGECGTGSVKLTELEAPSEVDYLISASAPDYSEDEEAAKLLASCYKNALDAAFEKGCVSVAFPFLSAGANGFPAPIAADISMAAVFDWFEAHSDIVMDVYFCCHEYAEFVACKRIVDKIREKAKEQ